jgi:hypothetical protein
MPGTVWTAEAGLVVDTVDEDRLLRLPELPPPQEARATDASAAAVNVANDDRRRRNRAASGTGAPRSSLMDSPSGGRDVTRT